MEMEMMNSIATFQPIAPMAEQEELPAADAEDMAQTSSSKPRPAESNYEGPTPTKAAANAIRPPHLRSRRSRKRREDPFNHLILSTKRMKLNEAGASANGPFGAKDGSASIESQDADAEMSPGQEKRTNDDGLVLCCDGESDDESADGYDDDEDSNAEDYYKNDYPEEEHVGNECENESTSEDDNFDHYGDEKVKYRNYCNVDEDSDLEQDDFD